MIEAHLLQAAALQSQGQRDRAMASWNRRSRSQRLKAIPESSVKSAPWRAN